MLVTPLAPSMCFNEAAAAFLSQRATINAHGRVQYVAERTWRDLEVYLRTLGKFFGQLRLDAIHGGHLRSYQIARANGDGFSRTLGERTVQTFAGAAKINDELGVLKRLMVGAGAWTPQLTGSYLPLQELEPEITRALSPEEQDRFLAVAAGNPEWNVVWWYALVALHTTFSSDEMRTVRQGDINLTHGILGVNPRYGKNKYRRREIPLTDGACLYGIEQLIKRSVELGGRGPERYLFPWRIALGHWDGNRPMSETGLRKPFTAVRAAAGVSWFRWNGFRHTAITRMAEAGVPIAIIMRRAGHVSPKMSAHYTHISEQVERNAMIQMDRRKPVVSIAAGQMRRNFA